MFKISIWYDETIATKNVPYFVRINYINCGGNIGCLLENQAIEQFMTPFAKNTVF